MAAAYTTMEMPPGTVFPRYASDMIEEALGDSPVVLIHGPRQCGKTTLARTIGEERGYDYYSFDDDAVWRAATNDPVGFVADLADRCVLDEVQRVPHLFSTLKLAIDRNRVPGRLLITGSSNILLMPTLSDSLAGRMSILHLHPLAQCEIHGQESGFLNALTAGSFKAQKYRRLGSALASLIVDGGYPAALARRTAHRRAAWYRDYVDTLVNRDVRDMSRIASLAALPRLMSLAASQTSRLINVSELSAPFHMSRPTIRDYMALLERVFLVETLDPWHNNRLSRLVKTPKLHLTDTGVACSVLGVSAASLWSDRELMGQMLETFVYQELRKQASWHGADVQFYHYRDKDQVEVDIVMEMEGRVVAGVEVKASSTITDADFRGLRKLQGICGKRFVVGVVLYDGEKSLSFGNGLYAVPVAALWEYPKR